MKDDMVLLPIFNPSPWIHINKYDWGCITKDIKPNFYKRNHILYNQGNNFENVYLVKEGRICLYMLSSYGDERSFFIADQGCLFGELSAIDKKPNVYNAMAVTDSYVYKIPTKEFIEELATNSEFSLQIISLLVGKMRIMTNQIKQLTFNDAKYKVYYSIMNLVDEYSLHSSSGYHLKIKFTHQELANLTGLSRVCVSNIISDLTKKDIIYKEDGFLVVKYLEPIINYLLDKS